MVFGPSRPPSPLLLPNLSHVQVQLLQALQRQDVLRVEGHVHHHQPADTVRKLVRVSLIARQGVRQTAWFFLTRAEVLRR